MRVGIVSYFAPPQPAVAAHRVLRLSRMLLANGHNVHWITQDESLLIDRDETLSILTPQSVVRHGICGPALWSRPVARNFIEKVKRTLAHKLSRWLAIPDPHIAWIHKLKTQLPKIVAREQLDAVLISCGPHGQLLAVEQLRRSAPNLKILIDYRDLLSGNTWTKPKSTRVQARILKQERRALQAANMLFVNTHESHEAFLKQIDDLPYTVKVMRNAADFGLANEVVKRWPAPATEDGIHLGFFGTIFPRRRLLPILQAMGELPNNILEQTTLHAYCGPLDSRDLLDEDLSKVPANVRARVQAYEFVPFANALRSMMSMTALILINGPEAKDNIFIPGKLYDYLMARRPVLFVGLEGDAWRIIEETSGQHHCFQHADTRGIAKAIEALASQPTDLPVAADYSTDRTFLPLIESLPKLEAKLD